MTDSAWRPNSRLQIIFADADCQFGSRQKAKICADFCSAALSAWWVYGAANENSANAKRQTTVSPATQAITTPPQTLRIAARIGAGSRFQASQSTHEFGTPPRKKMRSLGSSLAISAATEKHRQAIATGKERG
jgi:hypothetical protein